jgi:hypothetical protein
MVTVKAASSLIMVGAGGRWQERHTLVGDVPSVGPGLIYRFSEVARSSRRKKKKERKPESKQKRMEKERTKGAGLSRDIDALDEAMNAQPLQLRRRAPACGDHLIPTQGMAHVKGDEHGIRTSISV